MQKSCKNCRRLRARIKRIIAVLDTSQCPSDKIVKYTKTGSGNEHACCMLDIGHAGPHKDWEGRTWRKA